MRKTGKNLPEETELQIENANIDINKEEENPGIAYEVVIGIVMWIDINKNNILRKEEKEMENKN